MKRKSSFFDQILLAVTVIIMVVLTTLSLIKIYNYQIQHGLGRRVHLLIVMDQRYLIVILSSFLFDKAVLKKVNVGDIEIAYKTFGRGAPILLISGSGNVMDVWPSHFLNELAKGHKVTIFDNRGVGNTTEGTKPFSVKQFANDTLGLMNVLGIQKPDMLGFSMGSFVAQQLIITHPRKGRQTYII